MYFAQPVYLWGLFLISIPLIIHLLFKMKLKPIYFSTLRFLKISYRKKSFALRIHNLLLLLARISIIIFLFLFLSAPFTYQTTINKSAKIKRLILWDTSFSTRTLFNGKTIFKILKEKIKKSIEESPSSPTVIFDLSRGEKLEFSSGKNILKSRYWKNLSPSYQSLKEDKIISLLNDYFQKSNSPNFTCYLFSDFQKNDFHLWKNLVNYLSSQIPMDNLKLFSFSDKFSILPNLWIDKISFNSPYLPLIRGNDYFLEIEIKNYSDQIIANLPLKISFPHSAPIIKQVTIPSFSTKKLQLKTNFSQPGFQNIRLQLLPTKYQKNLDRIHDDNTINYTCHIYTKPKILIVYGKEEQFNFAQDDFYLRYAIYPQEGNNNCELTRIFFKNVKKDFSFANFDFIYFINLPYFNKNLISKIESYLKEGKNIVIIPGSYSDFRYYNNLEFMPGKFSPQIITADTDNNSLYFNLTIFDKSNPLLKPFQEKGIEKYFSALKIFKFYKFKITDEKKEKTKIIMGMEKNLPFLIEYSPRKYSGKVLIFTTLFRPQWNNFYLMNSFPAFFNYFTLYYSQRIPDNYLYNLKAGNPFFSLNLGEKEKNWELIFPSHQKKTIIIPPEEKLLKTPPLTNCGIYQLNSPSLQLQISVNPPQREMETNYFNTHELLKKDKENNNSKTNSAPTTVKVKVDLKNYFLYLLALMVLVELWLSSIFKHNEEEK